MYDGLKFEKMQDAIEKIIKGHVSGEISKTFRKINEYGELEFFYGLSTLNNFLEVSDEIFTKITKFYYFEKMSRDKSL